MPRRMAWPGRTSPIRERLRGPWRVAVERGEHGPAIEPGDWLLVDPTHGRWPRRGSIVVFREPDSRQARDQARGGPTRRAGPVRRRLPRPRGGRGVAPRRRDAGRRLLAAGCGEPIDSRRYGPVPVDALVGRVWFRYAPDRRIGRPRDPPSGADGEPVARLPAGSRPAARQSSAKAAWASSGR